MRRAAVAWLGCLLACAARQDGDAEARAELRVLRERQTVLERRVEQLEARQTAAASLEGLRGPRRDPNGATAASTSPAGPKIPSNLALVRLVPDAPPAPPLATKTALREPRPQEMERILAAPDEAAEAPALSGVDAELEQGLELIRNGAVEQGVTALGGFAEKHPKHERAALALYTAGVGLQAWGEPARALALLGRVADDYPNAPEAPGAMLRMAECNLRLKRSEQAKGVLGQVIERYPGSPAAQSAQLQLAELGQVGPAARAR